MISNLKGWWFKGLKEFSIDPKNVNLFIGANGTGKTNFADFIEFLSLTFRFGLKEAFDKGGGFEEVCTKRPTGKPGAFGCAMELGADPYRGIGSVYYKFTLSTSKSLSVDSEELVATVYPRSAGRPAFPERTKYDRSKPAKINFKRKKEKIVEWSVEGWGESPKIFEDDQNLILNAYGRIGNFRNVAEYLGAMKAYNIDAMLAKGASNGGDSELERYGANLVSFLKRAIEDEHMKEKLLADLREAVPYIKEIESERILTYTTLKFSEIDSKMEFRAQQMSDGTIRLLGLLAVLRQSVPPPVVVIEEPENALHSYAVNLFIRIAQQVSMKDHFPTQIFLTSHSYAVVDGIMSVDSMKNVPTQCFVTRRKKGTCTIEPASKDVARAIAKNLGRPSDFLREGDFEDNPSQLELADKEGKAL